jgi:L-serine deaminase
MEQLVIELLENLIQRKQIEINKISAFDKMDDHHQILISSGRVVELDFLIQRLNELVRYHNPIKIAKK